MNGKKEFGDYQTPEFFTKQVCDYLLEYRHVQPSVVIEPTCGYGNFLTSSLVFNATSYFGIEINQDYCDYCRMKIHDERVKIINANFFNFDTRTLSDKKPLLVLGNPPWVNNSTLSSINSKNIPQKTNFKCFKGIDALTGLSNFDICEYIILQLIEQYKMSDTTIAMLCKKSVARNVYKEIIRKNIPFSCCDIIEFDAKKIFNINVSACLLFLVLSKGAFIQTHCKVFSFETPQKEISCLDFRNGQLLHDISNIKENFWGNSCFVWRQGVKHDCSKIMELKKNGAFFENGNNECLDIETNFVYPLVKSSMFKSPIINSFSKYVIVTQKKVNEDTTYIKENAPKTWNYLSQNIVSFNKRKSSIYKDAPTFSMFGIGDYSFSKYKVGISGFNKEPLFSLLYSKDYIPVMTDDTSYFISFQNYENAYVTMLLLNNKRVIDFLKSVSFRDAKRPFTKKILEQISLKKIYSSIGFDEILETEQSLNLNNFVTRKMVNDFGLLPEMQQQEFFHL